jgi:hypothetical protein
MKQHDINEKDSLSIIKEMLSVTNRDHGDAPFFLILWGSITALYVLISYIAYDMNLVTISRFSWVIFPIGSIFSYLYKRRVSVKNETKTFPDRVYKYVWGSVGISLAILICFYLKFSIEIIIPLFLLIFSIASFVTGGILNFKPALIGGLLSFLSVIGVLLLPHEFQICWLLSGILLTTIFPGIMMLRRKKIQNNYAQ